MFSLVECNSYNEKAIEEAVSQAVDFSAYISAGQTVLVKPNLLDAFSPDKACTTHPSVVKAVVKEIMALGGSVIIADSPQGAWTENHLKKVYSETGMKKVADETGCKLNYNMDTYYFKPEHAAFRSQIAVMSVLKDVDVVVNVPTIKCHMMAKYTGAVKNLYGYVPGMVKMRHHTKLNMGEFGKILLDLEEHKTPVLTVVDAVVGMEGQGPSSGDPKELGLIFAGTNPYEIDYVICKIIGIDPMDVLYLRRAYEVNKFEKNETDYSEHFVKFKDANILAPFQWATKEYA